MLFIFFKYLQPVWYFNLPPDSAIPYWVDYRKLDSSIKSKIDISTCYQSEGAMLFDAAYQLLIKGCMQEYPDKALNITENFSIQDEYKFVKRFFNPIWCFYIFWLRILMLKNPVNEVRGLISALSVKRVDLFSDMITTTTTLPDYSKEVGLVSVVLPTLNRYSYLLDILNDLEKQTYKDFEVIVIDQSSPFRNEFYNGFKLDLKVIHQPDPGLWTARNQGVRESKGNLIAFTEDDVRVNPDWLAQHIMCMQHFTCDISAGIFFPHQNKLPLHKSFFRWAEQFASGNALVKKEVFEKVGLFDLQFERMRMGDGEFGLRCYLNGVKSVSNPLAYCLDVKAAEGGLRQMGSWDGLRPTKFFAPRPIPSVNYFTRKYFGNKTTFFTLILSLPFSIVPYRYKTRPILFFISALSIFFISPLLVFPVMKSWRISSKMLAEGSKIEKLDRNHHLI